MSFGSLHLGPLPKRAALAVSGYLRRHPEEVVRAARNATALKVGVPLAALRWLASELGGGKLPPDLVLEARTPGIFLSGSIELMKTPLKASTTLMVERIETSATALLVDVRLTNLQLEVTDPAAGTPVAALLQSGALDTTRPGDLLRYMPEQPELLVEARDDRFTLDLMRLPHLSHELSKKAVAALVPLVGIDAIATTDDHLDVAFNALPQGAASALRELKKLF